MKIISWNVNGISSLLSQSSESMAQLLDRLDADIYCFQEFKLSKSKATAEILLVKGYESYLSYSKIRLFSQIKQGYSGVTTYSKERYNPCHAEEGFSFNCMHLYPSYTREEISDFDSEGRVIMTDHGLFILFNIYFPNDPTPIRHVFKMTFYALIQTRITDLVRNGRNVILVGDLNTCHLEIDHCDPVQSVKDHNGIPFTEYGPRKWMEEFLNGQIKMIDLYRYFQPTTSKAFTCWNTQLDARQSNYGTRIDYIICNESLLPWFKSCDIDSGILGSDHCPVSASLFDYHPVTGESLIDAMYLYYSSVRIAPSICTLNWPEFQLKQTKLTTFFRKESADCIQDIFIRSNRSPKHTYCTTQSITHEHNSIRKVSSDSNKFIPKKHKTSKQKSISDFFIKPTKDTSIDTDLMMTQKSQEPQSNSPTQTPFQQTLIFQSPTINSPKVKITSKSTRCIIKPDNVPLCLHCIPAKEFRVNKPGPNKGKRFFVCSRAPGVGYMENTRIKSTSPEGISEFKCDFFQWAFSAI